MTRSTSLPARVLAGVAMTLALAGCVKKQPTEISPAYVPEGTPSPLAHLIAYPDLASTLLIYKDNDPVGSIGFEDVLTGTYEIRRREAGVNHLMLIDGTAASAFEVLRREPGGGYFSFRDYLIPPSRKWIQGEYEAYTAFDDAPSAYSPGTYMMRGMVGGAITPDSPLTNAGVVNAAPLGNVTLTSSLFPSDSLFNIAWQAVPGAAGYWVHAYQFLEAQQTDQIKSGIPAPLYIEKERDFFLGYFPPTIRSYRLGTSPDSVEILAHRTTLRGQQYLVRVAAVDANGSLIAYTYGDFGVILGALEYTLYPLGAKVIDVQSVMPRAASARPAGSEQSAVPQRMGNLHFVRGPR